MTDQAVDHAQDRLRIGVQVLVDRRAHDDDDVIGIAQHPGFAARGDRSRAHHPFEHGVGALLPEGHLACPHAVDRTLVVVVEDDTQSGLGECEAQREADTAAAAHDGEVSREARLKWKGGPKPSLLSLPGECRFSSPSGAFVLLRTAPTAGP